MKHWITTCIERNPSMCRSNERALHSRQSPIIWHYFFSTETKAVNNSFDACVVQWHLNRFSGGFARNGANSVQIENWPWLSRSVWSMEKWHNNCNEWRNACVIRLHHQHYCKQRKSILFRVKWDDAILLTINLSFYYFAFCHNLYLDILISVCRSSFNTDNLWILNYWIGAINARRQKK